MSPLWFWRGPEGQLEEEGMKINLDMGRRYQETMAKNSYETKIAFLKKKKSFWTVYFRACYYKLWQLRY
jgi:hypothetical protein